MMRAERDLATARLLQDKDEEWSFAAAYQAMRGPDGRSSCPRLPPKGSRSRDTHKTVVTASGVILGEKHKSLINKFDRMRRKLPELRGFETGSMVSRYEAGQAIRDAEEFFSLVASRLRDKYSQMSLLNDVPQLVSR